MISQFHHEMRLALARCRFLPGSQHKRFARDMPFAREPTEAQIRQLVRLCWRYRKQMPAHLVPSKDAVAALDADWNPIQHGLISIFLRCPALLADGRRAVYLS